MFPFLFCAARGRSWLRSPYGLPSPGPAPLPCSVIETSFEVTNSETAGGMLCQEPPHLRQFQRPDLAALDRGKINHAAQFGRWACQSPIPTGTIFGAKSPF